MATGHRAVHSLRTLYSWTADEPNPTAHARRRLRDALTGLRLPPERVEDALVMASELTANAQCHATTPCLLRLILTRAAVIVEVHDSDPRQPVLPVRVDGAGTLDPEDDDVDSRLPILAESGRGLQIVDALSQGRWGFRSARLGKAAWFVLASAVR
ncbi:anti-sigma regulatory factor (Ser/Thr protein kinase) [Kitasatospora sp. GAS204A]|uniref:ATP-binding protein n=1 Tax=unclassified Kitasatospora TaxID=2633591 RepID=UPI0024769D09|nr:ATP-binding protein [Kitasatospora sp. GAS204B]MDH6118890.1 anti-sigma regulatory factor (Ser/Thr protein kinase) [Kitasatospora sp. GAS204B]